MSREESLIRGSSFETNDELTTVTVGRSVSDLCTLMGSTPLLMLLYL